MGLSRRVLMTGLAALVLPDTDDAVSATHSDDHVFELRQYTLRGGQREALISIFEEHFIEPQDAVAAHVLGTFRDLDDVDRFVWMRGFLDMAVRRQALDAFYGGAVWHTYGPAANATMVDSGNVLLLRAASPKHDFNESPLANMGSESLIGVDIYYLDTAPIAEFGHFFDDTLLSQFTSAGARILAQLTTEEARNDSRLPVREHERTYVCVTRWPSLAAHDEFVRRRRNLSGWRDKAPPAVLPALMRKPEQLRLVPTQRSPLK